MSDAPVVHIGENSPEEVAYKLLLLVARADKTPLFGGTGAAFPTHKWILDTYAECIKTVRNPHERG